MYVRFGVELPALGAAQLAGLIEQTHTELKAQECRMPQLACAWADAHYLDSGSTEYQPVIQRACAWGGEGTPEVSADSTEPAEPNRSYVNAAEPDVPHHDEAEPDLTCEDEPEIDPAADEHQSPSMTVPPGFDAQAARPRAVLHFHLAETTLRTGQAIVRPEDGGPTTLNQLVEFLRRSRCQVRIQPVLDPTEIAPVDGYEIPAQLQAAVRARQVADVFPFGTCLSPKMDLDHTERYISMDYRGPPGQPGSATSAR